MSEHFLQPPPIPTFLDRSKWSPERWQRDREANRALLHKLRKRAFFQRKAVEKKTMAVKAEAERRANRKAERKELKTDRRQRKEQRQADRQLVILLIRSKKVTIGQMSKASGIDQPRIKSALRWLIAQNRISKSSPRQYCEVS